MLATSREARVFQEEQFESGNYNWKAIWNENTSQAWFVFECFADNEERR